ncbi:DUF1353 domain-containing protein [Ruania suaedae]|uniref:DUF1353 domain-containing protein n=1 Tax=Ruania suaedae TaxID=2897774 RepID=UPI001E5B13D0|nr:DUF1353 domain-containing protein [Ruania suaedae]UFU01677.1 DUF1353 domain-containing protein [Ruania suaedae]
MGRFFDVADGGPVRLEVRSVDGRDFTLLRRIGYLSDDYDQPFVVPIDLERFRTDFASVPWIFTWLVPRSGRYAAAAVLHDAIVVEGDYDGPVIDRVEADRIFRVALRELGTPVLRSWLMWAAVSIATMWTMPQRRWRWRGAVVLLIGMVTAVGLVATGDLFDLWSVLPWMGERSLAAELAAGAAAAVVVPSVLALSWGRFARAGIITGVALAFLVHVTLAIVALFGLYRLAERLVSGPTPSVAPADR